MQIITTHKNTDFDALASVMASKILYPDAIPILPKNVNPNVRAFMSIHKDLFQVDHMNQIDQEQVKSLILVDVNSWGRVDGAELFRNRNDMEIILWDHHMDPGDIVPTWECREAAGATISLIVRELKKQGKIITPMQATLFLTGLYEDTGNMSFPSTTVEDAMAAAYLLGFKADLSIVSKFLRPAYGENQKDILFKMLESPGRLKINGYTIGINIQDIDKHVNSLALVVGMYREIINADAAFGIFVNRKKEKTMVIGRSHLDEFNVGTIMRSMGGGGHPSAGSALIKNARPEAIKEWITELIQGNQQASVQISDLMSFPVYTIESDTPMSRVAAILREKGCTGLPVTNNGKLAGIISRRDFRKIRKDDQLNAPVKAFMQNRVRSIQPGSSPVQAAEIMVKHDIGRLPVLKGDRIIGIVTRSDVMMYFYDQLPD